MSLYQDFEITLQHDEWEDHEAVFSKSLTYLTEMINNFYSCSFNRTSIKQCIA
jgi:hypothetical protein